MTSLHRFYCKFKTTNGNVPCIGPSKTTAFDEELFLLKRKQSGLKVIKPEYSLKLKISAMIGCLRNVSASSQSLRFILSLRLLKFYNLEAWFTLTGVEFILEKNTVTKHIWKKYLHLSNQVNTVAQRELLHIRNLTMIVCKVYKRAHQCSKTNTRPLVF